MQGTEGVRVGLVQPRDLRGGAFDVAVHHQTRPVGEGQHDRGIGVHVPQAQSGQSEFVVADRGVGLQQHVRAGAGVVQVPGQRELLGDRVAADDGLLLDHEHLKSGARQVRGGDQGVVSGSDHHHIGGIRHLHHAVLRDPRRRNARNDRLSTTTP
jgi:hypothetical protein